MCAPLSIVIPTLNAERALPGTGAALIEGVQSGLVRELIVSDGGSNDATGAIAGDLGATLINGAAGRGGQLRRGAAAASGDWLLFLHADTHLAPGWSAVVAEHINTSNRAAYFRLRFRADGLMPGIVAAYANLRSRLGLPYGDQGLLVSRRLYDRVGGYQDMALMEDVAMARALRGQLTMLASVAATGAESYLQGGWLRRGGRNMWLLARYLGGADPDTLARAYQR
ncbi:glycosyltransferase [Rhodobacteraceae bacterium R_SAG10]|jgi:rSAM/selenodomain-associated transferase 2|nr:glycosyltransferase [Rhodobacteraceae bacterium R_SAG10]